MKWKTETRKGEVVGAVLRLNDFRLDVHRHIDYPQRIWLASCSGHFHCKKLASPALGEAKTQAKAVLQTILQDALDSLVGGDRQYWKDRALAVEARMDELEGEIRRLKGYKPLSAKDIEKTNSEVATLKEEK